MDDICGVESLECAQGLVDKILGMVVREVLCSNDTVHVSFHEFLNHCGDGRMIEIIVRKERTGAGAGLRTVYLLEVVYRSWFDDV